MKITLYAIDPEVKAVQFIVDHVIPKTPEGYTPMAASKSIANEMFYAVAFSDGGDDAEVDWSEIPYGPAHWPNTALYDYGAFAKVETDDSVYWLKMDEDGYVWDVVPCPVREIFG